VEYDEIHLENGLANADWLVVKYYF